MMHFTRILGALVCTASLAAPCHLVAAEIVFEEGIEYSNPDGQHLALNLARPKPPATKSPAVLCIHGGGFRAGNRDRWNPLCKKLAERGYVAATVSYRLAPAYPFPAPVHDVKAAVRWLRANAAKYQIDPERIASLGDSAGGHLAQFLGVTAGVTMFEGNGGNAAESSAVTCVVNYYGPSDFTKSYGKSVDAAEVLPLFLGGDLDHARRRHILASPLSWVTPLAAPTLLLHGTEDPYVAFEQATWMRDRLGSAGVDVELLELKGAGHGFKGVDAERAENALFEFLAARLQPAK
jgi:acetyl esterase/lipase